MILPRFIKLVIGSLVLVACLQKEAPIENTEVIKGKWVITSSFTDTLDFDELPPNLILRRGLEIDGSKNKPNGGYRYKIKKDTITLHWLFSSGSPKTILFSPKERYAVNRQFL